MTIVTDQPVLANQFDEVLRQDREIVALETRRSEAMQGLVEALAAAGKRVICIRSTGAVDGLRPGDTAHILEQIQQPEDYVGFYVLKPGSMGFDSWTSYPVDSGPHYTDSDCEFGHFYRGEQVFLGLLEGEALFARQEDVQGRVAKETI